MQYLNVLLLFLLTILFPFSKGNSQKSNIFVNYNFFLSQMLRNGIQRRHYLHCKRNLGFYHLLCNYKKIFKLFFFLKKQFYLKISSYRQLRFHCIACHYPQSSDNDMCYMFLLLRQNKIHNSVIPSYINKYKIFEQTIRKFLVILNQIIRAATGGYFYVLFVSLSPNYNLHH